MIRYMLYRGRKIYPGVLFAKEGEGEGSEGGSGGSGGGSGTRQKRHGDAYVPPSSGAIAGVIAQHGGPTEAVTHLFNENDRLKHENGKLRRWKRDNVPEGSRILTAADAKKWDAYVALGTPEEVTKTVKESGELKAKVQKADTDKLIAQVAGLPDVQYKPSVLIELSDTKKLEHEIRDETVNGKTVKVAYVKDAAGKTAKLVDYVKANLADYLPSLRAVKKTDAADGGESTESGAQGATGLDFPEQDAGAQGDSADAVSKWEADRAKRNSAIKNPLMPKA